MPDKAKVEVEGEDGSPPKGPHAACGSHKALAATQANESAVVGEHGSEVVGLAQDARVEVVRRHDEVARCGEEVRDGNAHDKRARGHGLAALPQPVVAHEQGHCSHDGEAAGRDAQRSAVLLRERDVRLHAIGPLCESLWSVPHSIADSVAPIEQQLPLRTRSAPHVT